MFFRVRGRLGDSGGETEDDRTGDGEDQRARAEGRMMRRGSASSSSRDTGFHILQRRGETAQGPIDRGQESTDWLVGCRGWDEVISREEEEEQEFVVLYITWVFRCFPIV